MWTRWSRVKVTTRGAAGSDGEIDCSSLADWSVKESAQAPTPSRSRFGTAL
jgi:hypothetical protein